MCCYNSQEKAQDGEAANAVEAKEVYKARLQEYKTNTLKPNVPSILHTWASADMNLLFSKPSNCYIVPSNRSFIGLSGETNFPWTKFDACLISMQCHLVNWPKGVPIPLQCKEHVHLKARMKTFGFRLLDNTEHLNILVRALAYGQEAEDAEGERSIIPNS